MNKKVIATAAVLLCVGASGTAMAFDGPPDHRRHMGFPQEFIDACKGKKEGDMVELTTPRGNKIMAACMLVALPEPAHHGPGEPPEGEPEDGR